MKTTLLFILMAWTGAVSAQLQSSYFVPGASKSAVEVNASAEFIQAGGTGLNWDFSNVAPVGTSTQVSFLPAANLFPAFPNAQRLIKLTTDSMTAYQIFEVQNGHFYQVGLAVEENGQMQEISFSDPKRHLPASIDLGQSFQDPYKSAFAFSDGGFQMQVRTTGESFVECDAIGSLLLPGASYPNVYRVVFRDVQTDSTKMGLPGFPEIESQSEVHTTTWNWYANDGSGFPLVFSVTVDSTFSDGAWEEKWTGFYTSNAATATLPGTQRSEIKLFPTVTDRFLTLEASDEIGPLDIFDAQGKGYGTFQPEKGTQNGTWRLNVENLPTGLYHIRDRSKWRREPKKLVFSKL